jgi:hypothetical protein
MSNVRMEIQKAAIYYAVYQFYISNKKPSV